MNLTIHHTFPEELKNEWNALLEKSSSHVPFLRYEFLRDWWDSRGGGEWEQTELYLVTAWEADSLVAVAPLFYTTDTEISSLLLVGAIEISDYLDLIVCPEKLEEFIAELLPFLAHLEFPWQQLQFHNLLEDSPTLPAVKAAAIKAGWNFEMETLQRCPYIPLTSDWETYLSGLDKKKRHEIRRKLRRANEIGLPISFKVVQDVDTLEAESDAFFDLMAQDEDKARFLTEAMREHMHRAIHTSFGCGCLNLAFLEIGNEKAAAYLSFDYLNRIWVYNSGINYKFQEYSPGWVLLGYMIQWAIENKRDALDFLRGDEEYKYRFGALTRRVVRAVITRK